MNNSQLHLKTSASFSQHLVPKISKETEELNTINQEDRTDRTLHPTKAEYTFLSRVQGVYTEEHRTFRATRQNLTLKTIEITECVL